MTAGHLYIINNTMFFTDDSLDKNKNKKSWLYMAKTDGSQIKCINPQFTDDIYVSDGWIYFMEGKWGGSAIMWNGVSKMRIDGTDKKVITKKKVWRIVVSGDWIYYNDMYNGNTGYLYKMKKDGTQITKITNDNVLYKINDYTILFNWKIFVNWIYYTNAQDGGKLYRISISGTDRKKLDDEKCTAVFLADESNFTHVLLMYILNNSQRTYKEFHINNDTGEIINGIITK